MRRHTTRCPSPYSPGVEMGARCVARSRIPREEARDTLTRREALSGSDARVVFVDDEVGERLRQSDDDDLRHASRAVNANGVGEWRQVAFRHHVDHVATILLNVRESFALARFQVQAVTLTTRR